MSEADSIARSPTPVTARSLERDLERLGVGPGMILLVHSSLSALGWVVGGAVVVLQALETRLGDGGTLVMPAFSSDNSEPSYWQNPPIPREWWPVVRAEMPAYDPALTPTRAMGRLVETFRTQPGTLRSEHPQNAFAARGPHAPFIVTPHPLTPALGEGSPLSRLYELDAWVLLLGVGHGNNSSLHLAEYRASFPGKRPMQQGAAVRVGGERRWVEFEDLDWNEEDFPALGAAFGARHDVAVGRAGHGEARLMPVRPLVDFGVEWLTRHRS